MSTTSTAKAHIAFIVPGDPVGKARARSAVATDRAGNIRRDPKTGRAVVTHYTPAKTRAYEQLVAQVGVLAMRGREPLAGGVAINLDAVLPIPASWPKPKRQAALAGSLLATSKPDLDNIAKVIKDGLNGVVWADDDQVVRLLAQKRYGHDPHVSVTVIALGDEQC